MHGILHGGDGEDGSVLGVLGGLGGGIGDGGWRDPGAEYVGVCAECV